MLKITEKPKASPRRLMLAGERVSKKYRTVSHNKLVRKREYKKLKNIVPAICTKDKVPKITVIEEAIKYIDELHVALAQRMCLLQGIRPNLPCQVAPHTLAPCFTPPSNTALMMTLLGASIKPHRVTISKNSHNTEKHR